MSEFLLVGFAAVIVLSLFLFFVYQIVERLNKKVEQNMQRANDQLKFGFGIVQEKINKTVDVIDYTQYFAIAASAYAVSKWLYGRFGNRKENLTQSKLVRILDLLMVLAVFPAMISEGPGFAIKIYTKLRNICAWSKTCLSGVQLISRLFSTREAESLPELADVVEAVEMVEMQAEGVKQANPGIGHGTNSVEFCTHNVCHQIFQRRYGYTVDDFKTGDIPTISMNFIRSSIKQLPVCASTYTTDGIIDEEQSFCDCLRHDFELLRKQIPDFCKKPAVILVFVVFLIAFLIMWRRRKTTTRCPHYCDEHAMNVPCSDCVGAQVVACVCPLECSICGEANITCVECEVCCAFNIEKKPPHFQNSGSDDEVDPQDLHYRDEMGTIRRRIGRRAARHGTQYVVNALDAGKIVSKTASIHENLVGEEPSPKSVLTWGDDGKLQVNFPDSYYQAMSRLNSAKREIDSNSDIPSVAPSLVRQDAVAAKDVEKCMVANCDRRCGNWHNNSPKRNLIRIKKTLKEALVNGERFDCSHVPKSIGIMEHVGGKICCTFIWNGIYVQGHNMDSPDGKFKITCNGITKEYCNSDCIKIADDSFFINPAKVQKDFVGIKFLSAAEPRVGEKCKMISFDNNEDLAIGRFKQDDSIVKSVCVEEGHEQAYYKVSSIKGSCGSPVVNVNGKVIGFHNGTSAIDTFFIPVTKLMIQKAGQNPSVFYQAPSQN